MRFSLWTSYGALNSKPVFDAFAHSIISSGHSVSYNDPACDINVIWSVLFRGTMAGNQTVWEQKKPTIVLEVGGIHRGTTWKVGLNGINRSAYFGEPGNDNSRAIQLGLACAPWRKDGEFILICGQHNKSVQWQGMPDMQQWLTTTVQEIRKHSKRPIIFRPHPRCNVSVGNNNIIIQHPVKIKGSYDDYDMQFNNIHATVSYSSNPGIHSILAGVPAFVGTNSLAYDVANDIDFIHDIENPLMPERTQWLNDYAHTEFTIEEIAQGIPLNYLTSNI
jgi:hypothetical protein|tara:strand:- start:1622 stop:2452 length:831 start_codon:yes stop_codon:yes gene_type:complete